MAVLPQPGFCFAPCETALQPSPGYMRARWARRTEPGGRVETGERADRGSGGGVGSLMYVRRCTRGRGRVHGGAPHVGAQLG